MSNDTGRLRGRARRAGALITAAAAALLVTACGGRSPRAGASNGPGGVTVQKMDSFAACMRGHGVPDFYYSHPAGTPGPNGPPVLTFLGYEVIGVNPQSSQFQSAMQACRPILGIHPPPGGIQHKQFDQMLKAAACMRSHGYPDWPDPSMGPNGQGVMVPAPPAGVDTSSPQFLAAAKACGVGAP